MSQVILDARHRYWKVDDDGSKTRIPGVTTVIGQLDKPALIGWAAKITARYLIDRIPDIVAGNLVLSPEDAEKLFYQAKNEPNRLKEEAGAIGTQAHTAVEYYLKTGRIPKGATEPVQQAIGAFVSLHAEMGWGEVLASEQLLYSPTYCYCGTLDVVAMIGARRYLVDVKTAKGFYSEMPMQLAAYAEAWEEMHPDLPIEGMGVVRLSKEDGLPYWGENGIEKPSDHATVRAVEFQKFLCLLTYYELNHREA